MAFAIDATIGPLEPSGVACDGVNQTLVLPDSEKEAGVTPAAEDLSLGDCRIANGDAHHLSIDRSIIVRFHGLTNVVEFARIPEMEGILANSTTSKLDSYFSHDA